MKKYGLNMLGSQFPLQIRCFFTDISTRCRLTMHGTQRLVSSDDQVKAYIKKIMSQLDRWMVGGKISRLVIVITNKDTGEHVERWQFDVQILANPKASKARGASKGADQENVASG